MTSPRRRLVAAVLTAVLTVLAVLAVMTALPGGASYAAPATAAARASDTQVQHVRVSWKGTQRSPDYVQTATIPGIGTLDLICKPHDTRIRLYTDRRDRETQLWMQKYEIKKGKRVVAVKTARIYRYAHADDDGRGGTGYYAHEGLNQSPSVENRSTGGFMYGVVSQQSSRAAAGGQVTAPLPVTTFELDWSWNGFDHPQKYRSCSIDATFTTALPAYQRSVLTWRGWQAEPRTTRTTSVPGVGRLTVSCPTDPTPQDPAQVWVEPTTTDAGLYVEDVRGEGAVTTQRTTTSLGYDATTGRLGPYPLPTNGSLRMLATNGAVKRWILLSAYRVTNDRHGPDRNLCEVAAGTYTR
ncbi:hypothetical protein [Nocardioides plantarum]|uniref:Uncharacterized protein n=1 Tax=Nocardioides plantarum TaxID=29299 RepID=A0ABV5KB29_9ACTN|nr:hypothetical protein [Nocardioides plantarum]